MRTLSGCSAMLSSSRPASRKPGIGGRRPIYLLGRYRESLSDIAQVLDLEPRHFGALAGRGLCLQRLGRPRAALEAFEAALRFNPYMEQVQLEVIRLRDALDRAI